jgi:hypothetical protein
MRRQRIRNAAILLGVVAVGGYWFWSNYSPYQICLRHAQAEGIKSGMPAESAQAYAEGLCTSKMPLRN